MNGDPTPTCDPCGGGSGNPIIDIWIDIVLILTGS